ncbi:MAG: hypothetical protein KDD34_06105 [Bdellovibrionales bacterium]|nr:hypothetical protein [Bdellovibrionales bacterium]
MKNLIQVFIFCLIFLFSSLTLASLPLGIEETFQISWTKDYQKFQCSDNVWRFRQRLIENEINISNFYFVYIYHQRAPLAPIRPQHARGERSQHEVLWSFHAFAYYQGWVLDFDYSDTAVIIPLDEYLLDMWKQADSKNWGIQIIPFDKLTKGDLFGKSYKYEESTFSELEAGALLNLIPNLVPSPVSVRTAY